MVATELTMIMLMYSAMKKSAKHRVFVVRRVPLQEDPVYAHRGHSEVPDNAYVDVHHVPADRVAEEVERPRPADRDDGEAREGRHDRDHGGDHVEKAIAAGGGAA